MRRQDALTLSLASDGAVPYFVRVLQTLSGALRAEGALICTLTGDQSDLVAGYGLPLHMPTWVRTGPALRNLIRSGGAVPKAHTVEEIRDYPIVSQAPFWHWMYFHPIETPLRDSSAAVIVGGGNARMPGAKAFERDLVRNLFGVIADEFRLISDIATAMVPRTSSALQERSCNGACAAELPDPTVRFLVSTLIARDRVLSRNGISYHGLKTWRKVIRSEQIEALKAIKSVPHPALEHAASSDLVNWIKRHFGSKRFNWIVPVPCGHSGEDCLSRRIAAQLSALTNVPMREAFNRLEVTGSSHPRTNRRRPAMRLREPLQGDILLIDDVATSGAHIEEAMKRLRSGDNSVVAAAWIADG